MRMELAVATSGSTDSLPVVVSRRRRLDGFELALFALFAAVSVWVLALDLWQVVVHGRVWTGTDGVYLVDQMQYLAWIRDASHHLLASNLFVLRSTPADYFQPAVAISGGLSALGIAPWLSLLLWKPVAVISALFAIRSYVYRSLAGLWPRRTALVLALFFGSFTIIYGSFSVIGDLFPGFLSWGYVFGLIALAALVGALLVYDRARAENRIGSVPGLLGAVASLLHPWHGELLIVVVIGAELMFWQGRRVTLRRLALPAVTVILTGLPLLYYLLLGRTDLSWQLAREASRHAFPLWSIVLAIAPLLLPAMLAYRERPDTFLAAVTRSWPLAAFAVFLLSATGLSATPLHAFQGITIPLSVLAVQGLQRAGWRRLPHRRLLGALVLAAFTIPATVDELDNARRLVTPSPENANFIAHDERSALDYLETDPTPGGVLSRSYLGAVVPGKTGRRTLIGDCLWSEPNCYQRGQAAQMLFDGTLPPSVARGFVRRTGARFVLADCQSRANLTRTLGPMILAVRRFGCASVYELDAPGRPTGPLAQSPAHAAVRAPRRQ
jgi:hypothetical protein